MKQIGTVDIEPKWVGLVPLFVEWLQDGTQEQRKLAISEINKMAVVCDEVREHQKKEKK